MSIKPHLLNDEGVLSYCSTNYWIWVCTDRRVLKYKQASGGAEAMHDLSFDEISGLSLIKTGRSDWLGGVWVLGVLASVLLAAQVEPVYGVGGLVVSAVAFYLWWNSASSYFEFRGTGLVTQEPEMWRIREDAAEDPEEVQEFVRAVRSRL